MTTVLYALTDTATTLGPAGLLLALMPLLVLVAGIALAEPEGAPIRWIRIETTGPRPGPAGHHRPSARRHPTGAPA